MNKKLKVSNSELTKLNSELTKLTKLMLQEKDQTMDNPMFIAYVNEFKHIKSLVGNTTEGGRSILKKYNTDKTYNEENYLKKFNQLSENDKLRCLNAFLNVGSYDGDFAKNTLIGLLKKINPSLLKTFYDHNNNVNNKNFWEIRDVSEIIKDRLKQQEQPKSKISDEDLEKEIRWAASINPSLKELPNEDDEEKAQEPGPDEAGEEKADDEPEEPDEPIEKIINELISEQLPKYKSGKNNDYYRQKYFEKNYDTMEKASSVGGGKTQKKKKRNRPTIIRQGTIKNKVRY
jgi:hypothetical protein